jgi:non-lysosomal glucosylceramidase
VAGSWAAASDACTDTVACKSQHGFFSDALYGQVLAYSVGLGTVVSSESKIKSHLEAELAANCFHADGGSAVGGEGGDPGHLSAGCDAAGMVILTGRPAPGVTDWMIWEGAAPNHATLAIRTGEAPSTALDNFHKSATSWSERINDQWNTAGIKDTDGYPTVTSHCK